MATGPSLHGRRPARPAPRPARPGVPIAASLDAGNVVGPAGFAERLGRYRDLLTPALGVGNPRREPQRHLYAPIADFVARSGKGLRPAL